MALRLMAVLMVLGMLGCAAPLAQLDLTRLTPTPPTMEAITAMLSAGRHLDTSLRLCERGYAYLVDLGFADDPTDHEWTVIVLSWRAERPLLLTHFGRGQTGKAEQLWLDRDGDGRYEQYAEGPEAIREVLSHVNICDPDRILEVRPNPFGERR